MKKLEKEQLPKVIALGAMATGLLGYAGYSWLGHGGAGAPAAAALAHPVVPKPPVAPAPASNDPVLALAPIDHENPFVPAFRATTTAPKPAAKPAAKPASPPAPPKVSAAPGKAIASVPDLLKGPAMDGDPGIALPALRAAPPPPAPHPKAPAVRGGVSHPAATVVTPAKPAARVKPAPPEGPRAPVVLVTGILEGQEDVAILKWPDTHGQVVRAGDHLAGGYVVKAIRSDAVVLALGTHEWVVRLGDEAKG
jgi:hypothetical protein